MTLINESADRKARTGSPPVCWRPHQGPAARVPTQGQGSRPKRQKVCVLWPPPRQAGAWESLQRLRVFLSSVITIRLWRSPPLPARLRLDGRYCSRYCDNSGDEQDFRCPCREPLGLGRTPEPLLQDCRVPGAQGQHPTVLWAPGLPTPAPLTPDPMELWDDIGVRRAGPRHLGRFCPFSEKAVGSRGRREVTKSTA